MAVTVQLARHPGTKRFPFVSLTVIVLHSREGRAVKEPGPVSGIDACTTAPVFISYATADRKKALAICEAIERRGTKCWISTRDVEPGANYQEEIVRAIRNARSMVLVFSAAANNSDEIKKELSLASRRHLPVLALRIQNVEPSDAFAYELSTRQWLDAFNGLDTSLDALVRKIEQGETRSAKTVSPLPTSPKLHHLEIYRRGFLGAVALTFLLALGLGSWLLLRPRPKAVHAMQIRLTGFERLSADVPATLPEAMRDEIMAAFNDDGVIGVSTSSTPPPGNTPSYALGGTIRHAGESVRVVARLTNENTGTTLWSHSFNYSVADLGRVPRLIAVDAGSLVRCGLFGASTYARSLPDPVLTSYLQFCHNQGAIEFEPTKALDAAHKVVAAVPDFSWGWSAVEIAGYKSTFSKPADVTTNAIRADALRAADTAVRLDPTNSEALAYKSLLIDANDLVAREKLLERALNARPLACGCEHHLYGVFLFEVGRIRDGLGEFQRSIDVLALDPGSHVSMGLGLIAIGRPNESRRHLQQAIDLSSDKVPSEIAIAVPMLAGRYSAALEIMREQSGSIPPELTTSLTDGLQALVSRSPVERTRAVGELASLPPQLNTRLTASLLAALGANGAALRSVEKAAASNQSEARSWLFYPIMAAITHDASFPAVAQRLGLIAYWKTTHTKPDLCSAKGPPPFCQTI